MLKEYQKNYATYFDKIKGDSLSFEDNDSTGILITKEYYTIPDLWKIEEGKKKAHFESFVIDGIIKKPADLTRNMPFSIRFPARYKEDIEINLPEEWDASESSNKIACANFLMKADFSYSYRKIFLQYEYESYKDNVSPAESPKFLESYNQADKLLAYVLTWENDNKINMSMTENKNQNGSTNFFTVLVILIIVGVVIWWTQRK